MSFFKKLFSSGTKDSGKTDKKTGAISKKELNPEHEQIVELYTQKNPTPLTSKEIVESIAKELGKKPGGVRSILSKAGVYVKQEKLTWKNDKKLALEKGSMWLGICFSELSESLQNDIDIAKKIATGDPYRINDLPKKFRCDREFMIEIIEKLEADEITSIDDKIKAVFGPETKEFFKKDSELLLLAWNKLDKEKRYLDIIIPIAFSSNIIDYPKLCCDKEFMLDAVSEQPENFQWSSPDLRQDSDLLDIVQADDFSDFLDRVLPALTDLRIEQLKQDLQNLRKNDDEEEDVIEIP